MMKNIDAIDEALRILLLESTNEIDLAESERLMQAILHADNSIEMKEDKKVLMFQSLTDTLCSLSFGQVIAKRMQEASITEAQLSANSNLPVSVIQSIMEDKIYTNNVPVVLMKKLLRFLDLTFTAVEQSVFKTFYMLEHASNEKTFLSGVAPAYRKGYHISRQIMLDMPVTTDGKELFQNQESLDKYMKRLNELLNQ